jgi:hypothetical protein
MKKMGRRWLGAILALTVGLLVFLLVDTFLKRWKCGGPPGVFQGVPLVLFAALITWLALLALARGAERPAGIMLITWRFSSLRGSACTTWEVWRSERRLRSAKPPWVHSW